MTGPPVGRPDPDPLVGSLDRAPLGHGGLHGALDQRRQVGRQRLPRRTAGQLGGRDADDLGEDVVDPLEPAFEVEERVGIGRLDQ
ncbi:hypothetical protein Misp01_30730 [Microtetraspora sp. NBRC 13810]|nr:hypothetical protein Misp01_30730 [Microtetraspora sp. NBRC 13810]